MKFTVNGKRVHVSYYFEHERRRECWVENRSIDKNTARAVEMEKTHSTYF